jgi:hypothetical protein
VSEKADAERREREKAIDKKVHKLDDRIQELRRQEARLVAERLELEAEVRELEKGWLE